MGFRLVQQRTLDVLNNLAAEIAPGMPIEKQVQIYQALSETLPGKRERLAASRFAKALSAAAAQQLEFSTIRKGSSK